MSDEIERNPEEAAGEAEPTAGTQHTTPESAPVAPAGDVGELTQQLEEETARAERYLANWQRAQADFVNYKRRTEQERVETTRFANATLILKLLPVVDDLERALSTVPAPLEGQAWVDGLRLIYRKLMSVLESEGLTPIQAEGQEFDPRLHEAVMYQEGEEGKVLEELQRGYKLYDRVIRPSMVRVGRHSADEQASGNEEQR